VVLVDHHDSFTHNLAHLVAAVTGVLPSVVVHDDVTAADVLARASHVVLGPGPGTPASGTDFSVGRMLLHQGEVPVLGVCLGLQGLAVAHGERSRRSDRRTGGSARSATTGPGSFVACRRTSSPFATTHWR
jgi:anthranilate/para-aminobenzoate synthase component II